MLHVSWVTRVPTLPETNALSPSWPGLTRPSTNLGELIVKIAPVGIFSDDEGNFPRPRPMLDVLFPLDRSADLVMTLGVDQPLQAVALSEALSHTLAILPNAPRKIAGDADIERPVRPGRDDVNPSALHSCSPTTSRSCAPIYHTLSW